MLVTIREWDKISVKAFIVAGKFKSGMYDFDKNYVYLPLTVAQELVGLKDKDAITGISIKLDDYRYANEVRDKLQAALGFEYYVQTWEDAEEDVPYRRHDGTAGNGLHPVFYHRRCRI